MPLVHEGLIASPFRAVGQSDTIPLPQLVTQPIALGYAYFENQMTPQLHSGSPHVCFSHGLSFLFSRGKPKPKSTLTFPSTCYGSLFACQALLILQICIWCLWLLTFLAHSHIHIWFFFFFVSCFLKYQAVAGTEHVSISLAFPAWNGRNNGQHFLDK